MAEKLLEKGISLCETPRQKATASGRQVVIALTWNVQIKFTSFLCSSH